MPKPDNRVVGSICSDCNAGEIKLSKAGNKYCSALCWQNPKPDAPAATPTAPVATPSTKTDEMTKADWSQKDIQISKTAIAKTFIQQGVPFTTAEQDAEAWLKWIARTEVPF